LRYDGIVARRDPRRNPDRDVVIFGRQIGLVLAVVLGAVVLLALSPAARGQTVEGIVDYDPSGAPFATGELIVTYEEEAPIHAVESLAEEAGGEIEGHLPAIDARLLEFPRVRGERSREVRQRDLARIKENLERDPAVESVDYNYLRTLSFTPNDPRFDEQWGLIKASFEDAWSRTRGRGVRIAVVDSGAAVRHPDLRRKIALTRDFKHNDSSVEDRAGHGTHVAGTVAAMTDNGTGVAGGCPACKLIIAKVFDPDQGYDFAIARGITWSADSGAEVINCSFTGPGDSRALKDAIDHATKKGAVVVAAAGNGDTNKPKYPAAYPGVIAVAATNQQDQRTSFSNHGSWMDVVAPGVGILSTFPGGYRSLNGTSVAAPHVSALAGLLVAQGRGPLAIKDRILQTALDLGPKGRDPYYGHGRIRADLATRR
jgi:thermitase